MQMRGKTLAEFAVARTRGCPPKSTLNGEFPVVNKYRTNKYYSNVASHRKFRSVAITKATFRMPLYNSKASVSRSMPCLFKNSATCAAELISTQRVSFVDMW